MNNRSSPKRRLALMHGSRGLVTQERAKGRPRLSVRWRFPGKAITRAPVPVLAGSPRAAEISPQPNTLRHANLPRPASGISGDLGSRVIFSALPNLARHSVEISASSLTLEVLDCALIRRNPFPTVCRFMAVTRRGYI